MTIEDDKEIIGFWLDTISDQINYWGFEYNFEEGAYYNPALYHRVLNFEYKVGDLISYIQRSKQNGNR